MSHANKKPVGAHLHADGASFRVWAPNAESVAVSGSFNGWGRTPLESEGDGYWSVEVPGAQAGQEYKYVIRRGDEELMRNDPRAFQLTTTAGNSVIADTAFDWGADTFTPPPLSEQVLYELHIGTFNRSDPASVGTFREAAEKLDYLAGLGINMIEIMPVSSMAMDRGWGYATDYIYAIEALYGSRYDFLTFVKEAHARGMGVLLDVVYNHFGPDESLDLWRFDGWSENGKGGIYFYNDDRAATPWGDTRPDFGRPEVRRYILDNVCMWLQECHLDGLRVDSTVYIRNLVGQNNDPAHDLPDGWRMLQEITGLGHKIKPQALLVAEDSSGNEYITKPTPEGGAGFDAQWEVGFPHLLHEVLGTTSDDARRVAALAEGLQARYNGDAWQRIIYSDSHDSAANGGTRLSEEIAPGHPTGLYARKRSLLAATLVLTAPGIPMLFQGQEFMSGGSFNDWQALDWEQAERLGGMVQAHRHLIDLKRNRYGHSRGLQGQHIAILQLDDANKVLAYHRWDEGGPGDDVAVVLNLSNKSWDAYEVPLPRPGVWQVRFNSSWQGYSADFKQVDQEPVTAAENGRGRLHLAPYGVLILSQDRTE